MGEEPDHSKIYVEAIMVVNKNKKSPSFPGYYGLGSANEYYYPNLFENRFTPREKHATQDKMRADLPEIQRHICVNSAYSCKLNSTRTTLLEKI